MTDSGAVVRRAAERHGELLLGSGRVVLVALVAWMHAGPVRAGEPSDPATAEAAGSAAEPAKGSESESGGAGRVSVYAAGFAQLLSRGLGAEAGGAVTLGSALSLGAAVTLGSHVGGQLQLTVDVPVSYAQRLSPRAQVRLTLNPLEGQLVIGIGGMLAAALRLGHGRVVGGFALEGYNAPPGFRGLAALFLLGYELDVFRPRGSAQAVASP